MFDDSLQATLRRGWGLVRAQAIAIRVLRLNGDGALPPVTFDDKVTGKHRFLIQSVALDARIAALKLLESAGLIASPNYQNATFTRTSAGVRVCGQLQARSERVRIETMFRKTVARDMLLAAAYSPTRPEASAASVEGMLRNVGGAWDWEQDAWRSPSRRGAEVHDKVSGVHWQSLRTIFGTDKLVEHAPPAWSQFAGDSMRHDEFVAAEDYLCRHGLLLRGRSTALGDACMEEFGGSVLRYMQHRRRIDDQKGRIMVDSKYNFSNTHFHGGTQLGDHNTQLNGQVSPQVGGVPSVKVDDLAALYAALQDRGSDEAIAVAAEVLKLQQSAIENSGELPAEKLAEATHSQLWQHVREVIGDVAGSAISGVVKALLGIA